MTEQLELDDMQGLLVRGYGTLPEAAFLLLRIDDVPAARRGLVAWADSVTSADQAPAGTALNIALTAVGIAALSPGGQLPPGFSEPFADGMVTSYRSRLLGDVGDDDPAGWEWGGPAADPVGALLLIYADGPDLLAGAVAAATRHAAEHGMAVVRRLTTLPLSEREAFGFRDGLLAADHGRPIAGRRTAVRSSGPASSCSATSTSTACSPTARCSPEGLIPTACCRRTRPGRAAPTWAATAPTW